MIAKILKGSVILGFAVGVISWAQAQSPALFSEVESRRLSTADSALQVQATPGYYPVQLQSQLLTHSIESKFSLTLPNGELLNVIHDHKSHHQSGGMTWFGYIHEYGKAFRVIIAQNGDRYFGRINTPQAHYQITTDPTGTWIIAPNEAGWEPDTPSIIDYRIPSSGHVKTPAAALNSTDPIATPLSANVLSTLAASQTVIDLMVVYTNGLINKLGDVAAVQARINYLVDITNQALVDSEVHLTYRLVYTQAVTYTDNNNNSTALNALTNGGGGLSGVSDLRQQYGADLVVLLRPYVKSAQGGCGIAWILGSGGQDVAHFVNNAYSVVSDGNDGRFFCREYSLAHELGHNMGNQHDRANASVQGAFRYSYGYAITSQFGTIMSYVNPGVPLFSNPEVSQCNNGPCGIDENANNSANNALSMNNTKDKIAAFMESATDVDTDLDGFSNSDEEVAGSNPFNADSQPANIAMLLQPGLNQVVFPVDTFMTSSNLKGLLDALGGQPIFRTVRWYDTTRQSFLEAGYDDAGVFYGDNLLFNASGGSVPAMLLDIRKTTEVSFTSRICQSWDLSAGINFVGTPCVAESLTVTDLLIRLGSNNVVSIQYYDAATGKFLTASYDANNKMVGQSFAIQTDAAYFIHMKRSVNDFRL